MNSEQPSRKPHLRNALIFGAIIALGVGVYVGKSGWPPMEVAPVLAQENKDVAAPAAPPPQSVDLTEPQLKAIKVGQVALRDFRIVKQAVGNVDFNQDMSTQVSSPYQGRILQVFAALGDRVERGQKLFTIESPDLLTAEATLIQTAGVLELTSKNLVRLRGAVNRRQRPKGPRSGDLRSADGGRRAEGGAFRPAHLREVGGRDRPDRRQPKGRWRDGDFQPRSRCGFGAKRRSRASGSARRHAGAVHDQR